MAGYAVTARIERVEPRRVAWSRATDASPAPEEGAGATAAATSDLDDHGVPIDLVGQGFDRTLADWIAGIRESWSQTMFFLLDPDSWR